MRYGVDKEGIVYQLQRCPFCGMDKQELWSTADSAEENGEKFDNVNRFTVVCNFNQGGCGATCGYHDTVAAAVARWNTRVVI